MPVEGGVCVGGVVGGGGGRSFQGKVELKCMPRIRRWGGGGRWGSLEAT